MAALIDPEITADLHWSTAA